MIEWSEDIATRRYGEGRGGRGGEGRGERGKSMWDGDGNIASEK